MNFILAIFIVMLFLMIGEWVSKLTHSYVPSVFITAALFVIGFWTFLPKNIVTTASYGSEFYQICMGLSLVHLGTLMSLKKLVEQWKAVCIALLGVLGTLILTISIGSLLFSWKSVVAAIPPLSGGMVSAMLITNGLQSQHLTTLVALPVSMFVIHSLIGYPLTSVLLKTESKRLINKFRKNKQNNTNKLQKEIQSNEVKNKKQIIPNDYKTSAFIVAKVALIALVGQLISQLIHNAINVNILYLVLGVIAHQIGFLEDNALNKAGVFNWLMYGFLAYIFSELGATSPKELGSIVIEILVLIVLGVLGMFIASRLLAKPFGMTWQMAFACSLTALFGFPADYILTTEVSHNTTTTKEEEKYVLDSIMPKMLVGGFATVSIASVFIASIFLKLL